MRISFQKPVVDIKIANNKTQTPRKTQKPTTKTTPQTKTAGDELGFRNWDLLGIWPLGFGISESAFINGGVFQ